MGSCSWSPCFRNGEVQVQKDSAVAPLGRVLSLPHVRALSSSQKPSHGSTWPHLGKFACLYIVEEPRFYFCLCFLKFCLKLRTGSLASACIRRETRDDREGTVTVHWWWRQFSNGKESSVRPEQCGSVGWASSRKTRGFWFSPHWDTYEGQLIDVSLSHWCFYADLSPSLPLSLKIWRFFF